MPSAEVFDDSLDRLAGCGGPVVDNYITAATRAGYCNTAELGTAEGDAELLGFLEHAFARVGRDERMCGAEKDLTTAKIAILYANNTCFNETVVYRAYSSYIDSHEQ